jgi:hypothetical protein
VGSPFFLRLTIARHVVFLLRLYKPFVEIFNCIESDFHLTTFEGKPLLCLSNLTNTKYICFFFFLKKTLQVSKRKASFSFENGNLNYDS